MQFSLSRTSGWSAIDALATGWDSLLQACAHGVRGPDVTCSSAWARALARTLLRDVEPQFLSVTAGAELLALVPIYRQSVRALPFERRELRIITEAYSGRSDLLLARENAALTDFVLGSLRTELSPWDVLRLSVVEGSAAQQALARSCERLSLPVRCVAVNESPYIELGSGWQQLLAGLPKKMRWTIRKSEKELSAQGRLEYETADDLHSVKSLLDSVYAIERRSWKEQTESSITAQEQQYEFYERLAEIAARGGILSAHVLRLNSKPIAYILGLTGHDGVFLDLKESFDASFADFSPGHVLKRFALEALISRGTRVYDFMGRCDPYKMRWTSKTYRTLKLALFNSNPRGSLWYWRSLLGRNSHAVNAVPPAARSRAGG